jgi:hypothetical protein
VRERLPVFHDFPDKRVFLTSVLRSKAWHYSSPRQQVEPFLELVRDIGIQFHTGL